MKQEIVQAFSGSSKFSGIGVKRMQIFKEFDEHLMNDKKPSIYFKEILETGLLAQKYPYTLLGALVNVSQSPEHHPEGDVWNHTMLVIDNAAERKHLSKNPRVLMWSALLHDLGKAATTKLRKGKITAYDHDKLGEKLSGDFLQELTDDQEFISQVSKMVRWHMQILFVSKGSPWADIENMLKDVSPEEIALLGLCDRLGRGKMTAERKELEEKHIARFLEKCQEYLR